ncbi:MAG TPA: hydroxymethylglutaryl-CoA lyase [Bryobacteraceae bacterium]|nr:hydroxymethylglutaryl-CoA lyase [Bryobacteraceae bacterium]
MTAALPARVRIVEVGPRDGLQNEPQPVPLETRVGLIQALADAGLKHIECGSFVSPKWVPQMAGTEAVFRQIARRPGVRYSALVPNLKGLEKAAECEADEVAVFVSASEAFSHANINCSIAESLERAGEVASQARALNIPVRGYVSCVLGCPYSGEVALTDVARVARALDELGCYEVSLGDTIGVGTPLRAQRMLEAVAAAVPITKLAVHYHDTYGQALANIYASLELGVAAVDSSVAGLGGCPYAPGAAGNVATETVLYMLRGMEIETGVDLEKVRAAGQMIRNALASRVS